MTRRNRSGGVASVLVALALVTTLGGYVRPPAAQAATSPFTDIAGTTFEADIEWLFSEGITKGCTATLYCPERIVTRAEMASFLARMFDLPSTTTDFFTDDETSTFEMEINRLAAARITRGCTTTKYCPAAEVRRDEMASFLARAATWLQAGAGRNYFDDDDGISHETNIDRLAAGGIASGCGTRSYCPSGTVTRGQMAAFLRRIRVPLPHPPVAIATLYASLDGSDAGNTCLDRAEPCRTIWYSLSMSLDGNTIEIGPGTFTAEGLETSRDLTITGDPAGGTTIDASAMASPHGIFMIDPEGDVTIEHLTLIGGFGDASVAGGSWGTGVGGAISNKGTLALRNSTIRDNMSAQCGGGIHNFHGSVTVVNSTISQNSAVDCGAGIVSFLGSVSVVNSTISGNTAAVGGGIGVFGDASSFELRNAIVVGNSGGDVSGTVTTIVNSIVGIPAGLSLADILDSDGLQDNGGPTQTIALTNSTTNPARHHGDAATCAAAPVGGLDQRGLPRTPPCDIGAYELQP